MYILILCNIGFNNPISFLTKELEWNWWSAIRNPEQFSAYHLTKNECRVPVSYKDDHAKCLWIMNKFYNFLLQFIPNIVSLALESYLGLQFCYWSITFIFMWKFTLQLLQLEFWAKVSLWSHNRRLPALYKPLSVTRP